MLCGNLGVKYGSGRRVPAILRNCPIDVKHFLGVTHVAERRDVEMGSTGMFDEVLDSFP